MRDASGNSHHAVIENHPGGKQARQGLGKVTSNGCKDSLQLPNKQELPSSVSCNYKDNQR